MRTRFGGKASGLASLLLIAAVLGCAYLLRNWAVAIYALSFWHYYLYWLAYRFGAVSLPAFKRDAMLMKSVSLLALGWAYFSEPLVPLSLAVMAGGFLLNAIAARALGSDRTYYGYELADLPPWRVTAFPYSWVAHPMLVGNIAAFGGTLLNADFRQQWWPLAATHVALNLGLLLMEVAITPLRRGTRGHAGQTNAAPTRRLSRVVGTAFVLCGGGLGAVLTSGVPGSNSTTLGTGIGTALAGYACAMYDCYTLPASPPKLFSSTQWEQTG